MNTTSAQFEPHSELSSDYALTSEQLESYQKNGHILLREVASAEEIARFRPVINQAAERFNTETRPFAERDTYGKAFLQIENLWVRDEGVKRFTLARRFAKIAADLMGVRGVRIYHDQALFKEPGGGPTPFHQDQYYWSLNSPKTITMWMPLVPISEEVGSMTFASGSQNLGFVGKFPISDESETKLQVLIVDKGLQKTTYGAMQPGDATFHAGWTLHGAPGNPTDKTREVMTIIYMDMDMCAIEPDNENRAKDLANWTPGIKPGELCASPLNPIVYQRD